MQNNPGVILNIASVGGLRAEHGLGVYNLTKAAVIHLTSQLACELGKTRVVGIAPGLVKTLFASVLIENVGDKLASALPTKRLGEPQDIAEAVLFLASRRADLLTQQGRKEEARLVLAQIKTTNAEQATRKILVQSMWLLIVTRPPGAAAAHDAAAPCSLLQ